MQCLDASAAFGVTEEGYGLMNDHPVAVITHEGLAGLIDDLRAEGLRVVGPTLRDQAIVYDDIE